MPDARRTRSLVCEVKKHTSVVTTGTPKQSGIPCTMVLAAAPRSPRCLGLVSHRRLRIARKLDPSVEGTGPHGLTVRAGIARLRYQCVHRIPRHVS